MSKQLNERERWLVRRACFLCLQEKAAESALMLIEGMADQMPPDPRTSRITELEREVERLNGLLCEFDGVEANINELPHGYLSKIERQVKDILSRRTAERKERGDG